MIAPGRALSIACSTMNRRIVALTATAILAVFGAQLGPARAETVEVAPGVEVTRKAFAAPASEAPFFGLADKEPTLRQTDDIFISIAVQVYGSRTNVYDALAKRGWDAIAAGDMAEAGTRLNQAWLFVPGQSPIFHGFAVIALKRFHDQEFAEELFRIARKAPGALSTLNADYGHMLLAGNRPEDAEPILEQAVKDTPTAGQAWADLGVARLQNGNPAGACVAADRAEMFQDAANVNADIKRIWREARCSGH
jgi:tetratricopeptide (TPR) repeat protein